MANPLKVLTDLHLSGTNSSVVTISNGAISGSSTLKVGSSITGANGFKLESGNIDIGSGEVTASAFSSSGTSYFTDVKIQGDLQIQGSLNAINRTDLYVTDKVILVASGSANAAAADGAGLSVSIAGVSDPSFTWNQSGKWVSTEDLDIAVGKSFRINSNSVLKDDGYGFITLMSGNADSAASVRVDSNSVLLQGGSGGSGNINIQASGSNGNGIVQIGRSVTGPGALPAILMGEGVDANSPLYVTTGSTSRSFNFGVTSSYNGRTWVDVVKAIDALDNVLGDVSSSVNTLSSGATVTPTEYYSLRTVVSGTKTSGATTTVTFILSGSNADNQTGNAPTGSQITNFSASTAAGLMQKLGAMSFDVAVRNGSNSSWTNDLVSVNITASAQLNSFYWPLVVVDAPGVADNTEIRLIAVNETSGAIS